MEKFLSYLISPLLVEPDKLTVAVNNSAITVSVGSQDTGRVIGKHGSVIHSLRVLLKTFCSIHRTPQVTLILNTPPKEVKTD